MSILAGGVGVSSGATGRSFIPKPFHLIMVFNVFSRKITTSCGFAFVAIVIASPLFAQTAGSGRVASGRPSAQVATVKWRPVRPVQAVEELPVPSRSQAVPQPVPQPARETVDGVPLSGGSSRSVMRQYSSEAEDIYHEPLDGEIIYEGDMISGAYGCDSIGGCDGGCCEGGCDSAFGCHSGSCAPGGNKAWRPCLTICLPEDGWVSFEYLGWFQSGMSLPPLVTTSVGTPLPPAGQAGVLGQGPTRTLFGGEDVLQDGFSGGRLQFGFWLDRCHTWAVAAEYFELGSRSESFSGTSNQFPVLARPFFNMQDRAEDSQIVSYPNVANGGINATVTSGLVGGGFHFRRQTNCNTGCGRGILCDGCSTFHSRTDGLFGYRYLQLDESLGVQETINGITPAGTFRINDQFRTRNQFNGFDMGMAYRRSRGPWSLDLLAKLAIGNTRQTVDINGSTLVNGVDQGRGGFLAQTSNIGSYSRDRFTILPELGANVGYQLTHNLRLKAGYTMIFWSNVVRPGDQVDLDINPDLFPPAVGTGLPARPRFDFRDTDYWVQGMSFGGEFTW